MSLGAVSASCLSPLGQFSSKLVDLKQFNLCKYSTLLLISSSNLRSHSCVTEVKDGIYKIVNDLLPMKGLNISVFFIHLSPFHLLLTPDLVTEWLWLTSLCSCFTALSFLVPTCLCSSFLLILVTLGSFHFLIVTLIGLRLLKRWF